MTADADVEQVIIATAEAAPKDAAHCPTRSSAAEVGLWPAALSRIWRAVENFATRPMARRSCIAGCG
jgi:hypothetical protein